MYVNIYYKDGHEERIDQVKRTKTEPGELIITIEKKVSRYAITQAEIIETCNYGEEIHTIEGYEGYV